jgi:photosystem II stability/assembly factor-like uncharacterized protein
MTTLLAGMENSLFILESTKNGWKTHENLKGTHPQSIAFDHQYPNRAYCGTFGDGLWKTDNNGQIWENIGKNQISNSNITSVSVSSLNEEHNRFGKVYVGTEPSALYVSSDGGESWEIMSNLNKLESSKSWSFPPRPWTHHVCWIETDVNNFDYIFVAIEAGALVQSRDGGRTWIDRNKQGPYDTHTLLTHKKTPKRLYSAAGDGYFESFDYGESWNSPTEGLEHHYLDGLAVDSTNPQNVIISASLTALQGHNIEYAESFVYRRSADGEKWKVVSKGLPEHTGTIITILASNPFNSGEFYALNNRGIFSSTDSGVSWTVLDVPWLKEYLTQHPWALSVGK